LLPNNYYYFYFLLLLLLLLLFIIIIIINIMYYPRIIALNQANTTFIVTTYKITCNLVIWIRGNLAITILSLSNFSLM